MRNIGKIRLIWFACALLFLNTEVVCATSGWGNVKRDVGNDCYVSINREHICSVTTRRDQVRIRVWCDQKPEYDFNSSVLFFRFHPTISQDDEEDEETEYYLPPTSQTEKIDFDYLIIRQNQVISTEWTYFIVDKGFETVSGPFTEAEFNVRPEAVAVTQWNWKNPEKSQSERRVDTIAFACVVLAMIFVMNLWWIGPLILILIVVVRLLRKKRRSNMA